MKVLVLALAILFATSTGASADVFTGIASKLKSLFDKVRTIVFVVGGFGLVGLGVGAIFGAVKWKWFAAIGIGLAAVAAASAAVNWAAGEGMGGSVTDTFKAS